MGHVVAGVDIRTGANPFAVDPRDDLLHAVPGDRPGWSGLITPW